ncbi:MAG: hypothetical protein HC883_03755 [Bdellovibrionaceae bacterium]|nr:hypothetical protein [Pseudobdellovibrionaceae bacterium]
MKTVLAFLLMTSAAVSSAQTIFDENKAIPKDIEKFNRSGKNLKLNFKKPLAFKESDVEENRIVLYKGKVIMESEVGPLLDGGSVTLCSILLRSNKLKDLVLRGSYLIEEVYHQDYIIVEPGEAKDGKVTGYVHAAIDLETDDFRRINVERSYQGRKDNTTKNVMAEALKITPKQMKECFGDSMEVQIVPAN